MNLTLSLGINGGAAKKRKVRDSVVGDDDGDGGDCGRVFVRLLEARERMVARLALVDDSAATGDDDGGGLRLMHLLLSSVAAAESGDAHSAAAALGEVYRRASFHGGDPARRVAAYLADALVSRLLRSQPVATPPTRAERFLAYTMFYQASPLHQFAHFTANQVILEAFQAGGGCRRRLHVVDLDVSYGFQWPSLIQSLSDAAATSTSTSTSRDGGGCDEPVSLRITGYGTSADELRQTEARLTRFASGCPNLRFEFDGIVSNGPNRTCHDRFTTTGDDAATVVVNLVFPAAAQNPRTSSREAVRSNLNHILSLVDPSLVFLVEKDDGGGGGGGNAASRRRPSSLLRFTASLRYFAAVFDSLHECLPVDSTERLAIERNHLGREISNAMASLDHHGGHGDDHHTADVANWKEMMEGSGFEALKLSSRTVSQAKLLLKMKSGCGGGGGGFRVIESEGGRAMSLGWRDSALITATGWRRRRRSSDGSTRRSISTCSGKAL